MRVTSRGESSCLAKALETTIWALMSPPEDSGEVKFPSRATISARSVALSALAHNDRSVTWDGEEPVFTPDKGDVTAQVVVRPRWLAGPSPVDPAFPDGGRAPLAIEEEP